MTIGFYNVIARDRPDFLDLRDPVVLRNAVYWWCFERAPSPQRDDRLITDDQVAVLLDDTHSMGEVFALNWFMTLYFERHEDMHDLSMGDPRDRCAYFHYLVLLGLSDPYLLRFLPRGALRAALQRVGDTPSMFEQILAKHAFTEGHGSIDHARDVYAKGVAIAARAGMDLDSAFPALGIKLDPCEIDDSDPSVEDGVAVIGPYLKASGLGQAARFSLACLDAIEIKKPTALLFDLDNPSPDSVATGTVILPYDHARTINLIHLNAPTLPLLFAYAGKRLREPSYNIGFFFWELNLIPPSHALALELVDEIWVSSEYNREVYARQTRKPVINVGMGVMPLPSVKPMNRVSLGIEAETFVFLATFDSFSFIERKNPRGLMDAFCSAFPIGTENVCLILKTQNRRRVDDPYQMKSWSRIDRRARADGRIFLIDETYSYEDLLALKLACDCYVSLHRSEGWGFGMIEAMQLGKPVIATAFSGNMEFCNEETAFLVDYDLVGVRDSEYQAAPRGSHWAEPRLATAADRMREVAGDRVASAARAVAAAAHVDTNFSIGSIAARYASRLACIRALDRFCVTPLAAIEDAK